MFFIFFYDQEDLSSSSCTCTCSFLWLQVSYLGRTSEFFSIKSFLWFSFSVKIEEYRPVH